MTSPLLPVLRVLCLGLAALLFQTDAVARKPEASWDDRCEQCHGEPDEFARKYLWNVDGQLQGHHHIEDLHLFMKHHYIPAHEIKAVKSMLLSHANSPRRFDNECGECHGTVDSFVEQSIWVRGESMTAMNAGLEVSEFLPTHRDLGKDDIAFYLKLFTRVAK